LEAWATPLTQKKREDSVKSWLGRGASCLIRVRLMLSDLPNFEEVRAEGKVLERILGTKSL
jgi:hypothetical protein